jgi:hypothetical protein
MEHIGKCVCHFTITDLEAKAARAQAQEEEVGGGKGGFFHGVPGEHEWEVTGGAVKWWPRWGDDGEASLFANFYFTPGEEEGTVHICTDVYQPSPLMEHDEECPWYSMSEKKRAMAYRAFWELIARGLVRELEIWLDSVRYLSAIISASEVEDIDIWSAQRRLSLAPARAYALALGNALERASRCVPPAGGVS